MNAHKRKTLLLLTAAALSSTFLTAANAADTAGIVTASTAAAYRDGSYAGPVYNAYYGYVQVEAQISNGRLVGIDVLQYPNDRRTSRYINSQALPMLESEVIRAQSANVNMISGATLTSNAYLHSLDQALAKAGQ